MTIGEVRSVESVPDTYYVDTGMYDTANYGAVYLVDAERPAIVETGIGTHYERILGALETVGLTPADVEVIALTHVHLDHAGGAGYLVEECPNASVHVHEIGAPHLVDPGRLWEGTKRAVGGQIDYYAEPEPVPEERVVELEDGDAIDLGDRRYDVAHAPGHAPHQVVFVDADAAAVFTGDAAGLYVPARDEVHPTTPPPNFDLEAAVADARRIAALDPETLLYTHFGPAPAAGKLDAYVETLEDWVAAIDAAADELDDEAAVIERFVAKSDADEIWGEEKARYETEINVRGVLASLS